MSSTRSVVVSAPAGVTEADVVVVLQALLDRHAMLRLRVDDDGDGGWSLTVPEPGRWMPVLACNRWTCSPMKRCWRRGRG